MNATQDASNDMQNDINKKLISFNDKQNELIFSTRERLFKLEKTQSTDAKNSMCNEHGNLCCSYFNVCKVWGSFMVNGETFKITYYAKKHSKFIERNGKWDEKMQILV